MAERDGNTSALRPTSRTVCIVMACTDMNEANLVGQQLLELNNGCLVTYRRAEDLMHSPPAGKVALIILATADKPAAISRTLKWLRNRWPRCPITVVGDRGGGELEMAARQGAALYLTRPVSSAQWAGILSHVLKGTVTPKMKYQKETPDSSKTQARMTDHRREK